MNDYILSDYKLNVKCPECSVKIFENTLLELRESMYGHLKYEHEKESLYYHLEPVATAKGLFEVEEKIKRKELK